MARRGDEVRYPQGEPLCQSSAANYRGCGKEQVAMFLILELSSFFKRMKKSPLS